MINNPQAISSPTDGIWTELASDEQINAQMRAQKRTHAQASNAFPLAVKANIGVTGFTRSAGSHALTGKTEPVDAPVVAALRAAGAIVVGMTNMHELAFGITSNNPHFGQVCLPKHEHLSAGGSSGGSAAAVAEGSVEIALGTDTGGSVSVPASHCGVYGFRPTTGRWPNAGIIGLSWTRDTPGVSTRRLSQASQVDSWITGQSVVPAPNRRLRLGLPREFMEGLDPYTAAAVTSAIKLLRDHATIVNIDFSPVLARTGPAEMPTVLWESKRLLSLVAAEFFETTTTEGYDRLSASVMSPDVKSILQSQYQNPVTAAEYSQAQQDISKARAIYSEMLLKHDLDALIFPSAPATPPPAHTVDSVQHLGETENAFHLHTRHSGQGTMLATPMVTIPLSVSENTPPVGLTIQGSRFADRAVLSIAQSLDGLVESKSNPSTKEVSP
ncbi:indoleacetamide hydrolase [Yaniella flava]|uniref:Indoleacetamide hydrolase n=1 Tax=Yaniella flava TaxID=287930 RepID=A0ABN2UZN3_9MICC